MSNLIVYRLYKEGVEERLVTAKRLKDDSIYQLYPKRRYFDTLEEWRAAWPECNEVRETKFEQKEVTDVKPKISCVEQSRRNREIMEFFEPDYLEMVQHIKVEARAQTKEPVVFITEKNGTEWEVLRTMDFMRAPLLWKNREEFGKEYASEYSPALTAVRWWMMIAFTTSSEDI
jgi:hypothetical protein